MWAMGSEGGDSAVCGPWEVRVGIVQCVGSEGGDSAVCGPWEVRVGIVQCVGHGK